MHLRRMLCTILALLLCGTAALAVRGDGGESSPGGDPEEPRMGDVFAVARCEAYISLRPEPRADCDALARIRPGGRVRFLGDVRGAFAHVAYDGETGYVLWKYLDLAERRAGAPVEPSAWERYNINLFLSNFSEQDFGFFCWDMSGADAAMVNFYVDHCWFNRYEDWEWGEWGGYNVRIHDGGLAAVARRYFGAVPASIAPGNAHYAAPYFYRRTTGGEEDGGFVCLDSVDALDGERYIVRFHRYGMGGSWERDACGMTPAEAERAYPLQWMDERPAGYAIIRVQGAGGDGALSDRAGFSLEEWFA